MKCDYCRTDMPITLTGEIAIRLGKKVDAREVLEGAGVQGEGGVNEIAPHQDRADLMTPRHDDTWATEEESAREFDRRIGRKEYGPKIKRSICAGPFSEVFVEVMGWPIDIDEYATERLRKEVETREKLHKASLCSYCKADHGKFPACKFPSRHSGKEI